MHNGSCGLVVFLLNSGFGAKTPVQTKTKPKHNPNKTKTRPFKKRGSEDKGTKWTDFIPQSHEGTKRFNLVTLCLGCHKKAPSSNGSL